jgi:uncharacterized protein
VKELVEYIAKALVDSPDQVEVTQPEDDVIELMVAEDDRGKIIGRKGRTAHAIRTLLAAASKTGNPVQLEILD